MTNYLSSAYGGGYNVYGDCHAFYSQFIVRDGNAPIAILHHPHGSSADAMVVEAEGWFSVIEYLGRNGYIVVVGDFADTSLAQRTATWGNAVNQAAITEAKNVGVSMGGSSSKKVLLVGFSMGACAVMGYAGRYPSLVAGVLGIIPALDIAAYKSPGANGPFLPHPNQTTPAPFATIDAAYSGGYSNGTYGSNHNPRIQAAEGKFNTMPIELWVGDYDTYASHALVSGFYDQVKALAPAAPITLNTVPGTGNAHNHLTVGLVPKSRILAFAQSCVT